MAQQISQSLGRQTQFLTPSKKQLKNQHNHDMDGRYQSEPKHSCVHQYQIMKPYYNCPRCFYWNAKSHLKMDQKRKSSTTGRDPNYILQQRARMIERRELKQRKAESIRQKSQALKIQNQQKSNYKQPSELISPQQKNSQQTEIINDYKKSETLKSESAKTIPGKDSKPEQNQKEISNELNRFNPTSSLKPPNRLVLNKYPGGIKTKYMEDYPVHSGSIPQPQKIERKSLLHQPFQHKMETQTLKNIDFQGKQSRNFGRVKHQENLKVDHDIPFFGGTSYSNGFLNWGSAGSPTPKKPQIHQVNLPLNARTSYGDAFKLTDNFTKVKPTIDKNAWYVCSGIFPKSKFVGETTKSRDFVRFDNVEKTGSWKPIQTAQTGLRGIFDTTHKSSFQTYEVGGKERTDMNTLKAPIF